MYLLKSVSDNFYITPDDNYFCVACTSKGIKTPGTNSTQYSVDIDQ